MANSELIAELHDVSSKFIKSCDYESGIFWMEKVCILTKYSNHDLYLYINLLIRSERHHCALGLLRNFDNGCYWIKIMSGICYSATENCSMALDLFSSLTVSQDDFNCLFEKIDLLKKESPFIDPYEFISTALFHKASLLEYSGHVDSTLYYSFSLICFPVKFASARKLIEDSLLTCSEIDGLINEIIKFNMLHKHISAELMKIVIEFYKSFIDKNTTIFTGEFSKSWDVRRWKAQKYLDCKNAEKSLEITKSIMKESSSQDFLSCISHAIGLFQNLDSSLLQLFSFEFPANNTINYFSKSISLFITSLKFVSEGKSNDAHGIIQKAVASNWNAVVRMQPWSMSPSLLWMLQGHASWNCGDNENALASFVAAADSTPGLIWPWFCEYCMFVIEKTISQQSVCELDNIGVNNYLPIFYLNLAHSCLKLGELNLSLKYAQEGLSYNMTCTSLMRIIGYLQDLMGDHESAQLMYHRSLLLSPQICDMVPKDATKMFDYTSLPPVCNYRTYRQQDIFCSEMLKLSSYPINIFTSSSINGPKSKHEDQPT
ncbi:LOW QUALITY PROTEIN: hypothetical protein MXB_1637 [Myxobolus squamalis]|nr:LOW QUALITY PROTEIN: hypothetical protein MXB_1637 [Myxobolus squamalis]